MSSKKARRKQRREKQEAAQSSGRNPATLFMLGIAAVVVLTVVGALVFGVNSAPEDPPWPGAVWSADHGHWH
jgi:cell division protein FtsN